MTRYLRCSASACLQCLWVAATFVVLAQPDTALAVANGKASTTVSLITSSGTTVTENDDLGRYAYSETVDGIPGYGNATATGFIGIGDDVQGRVKIQWTTAPPPGTTVAGTADVVAAQEWRATGASPFDSVTFDAVLSVDGQLDPGGSGSETFISAQIGFGTWYEDPGLPDGFGYDGDQGSFDCSTGNLGADCFLDDVDASGLTVTINFLTIDLNGQVVIPNIVGNLDENRILRVAPRLSLVAQDDTGTFSGFDPAIADFIGSISVQLVPQNPAITLSLLPPPSNPVPTLGAAAQIAFALMLATCGFVALALRPSRRRRVG